MKKCCEVFEVWIGGYVEAGRVEFHRTWCYKIWNDARHLYAPRTRQPLLDEKESDTF